MIFHFSDGEFSGPTGNITGDVEKINRYNVIIAFSVTLEKLNRNPQP